MRCFPLCPCPSVNGSVLAALTRKLPSNGTRYGDDGASNIIVLLVSCQCPLHMFYNHVRIVPDARLQCLDDIRGRARITQGDRDIA